MDNIKNQKEIEKCPICLEEMCQVQDIESDILDMENGKRLLVTKCWHVFHLNCLSKHFYYKKDKCPICKTCIIEFSMSYINTKLSLLNNYEEIKKYIYGLTTDEKNAIDPMV